MRLWDYTLEKKWQPETRDQWQWFLRRKINYDDWKGIKPWMLRKYGATLKLDEGKRLFVRNYLKYYGTKKDL
jgi:hypothetical protein